mmetsp:Transcript_21929/g.54166  ORF Transcript_21929/g.54166 Transcript_21929/m.54166 type:complete len:112 (-) Transcript_21929:6-341(-)
MRISIKAVNRSTKVSKSLLGAILGSLLMPCSPHGGSVMAKASLTALVAGAPALKENFMVLFTVVLNNIGKDWIWDIRSDLLNESISTNQYCIAASVLVYCCSLDWMYTCFA